MDARTCLDEYGIAVTRIRPYLLSSLPMVVGTEDLKIKVERKEAEPTLEEGGGELVREAEMDALTMDALSEMISLTGVAGR